MTKPQSKIAPPVQIALIVVVLVLIAVAGYFMMVSPQHSSAADLQKQIDATQQKISDAQALTLKAKSVEKIRVADLFKLTKAMPDQTDEPGIILELNNIAHESGITFESISPQGSTALSGYQVVPIEVVFEGNFYQLSDFLFRVRNLVDVRRGALDASGRLFAVDNVAFDPGPLGFPQLRADLRIVAFVYGTGQAATVAPPQATSTTGSSTTPSTTSTTPGTTTPSVPAAPPATSPPASGATPAGATQ